jgi:hypothetical protein
MNGRVMRRKLWLLVLTVVAPAVFIFGSARQAEARMVPMRDCSASGCEIAGNCVAWGSWCWCRCFYGAPTCQCMFDE